MKHLLAFGDSNTWGLIPGTQERYPWAQRWTGLLQQRLPDVRILEEGLCGRTTVFDDPRPGRRGIDLLPVLLETHRPLDAAIIMLGTNDCKSRYRASAADIAAGMERCLEQLEQLLAPERILLLAPILLGEDVWRPEKDPDFDRQSVQVARELGEAYRSLARRRGVAFLNAADYAAPSAVDDEHLTAQGHAALAEAIYERLRTLL